MKKKKKKNLFELFRDYIGINIFIMKDKITYVKFFFIYLLGRPYKISGTIVFTMI